MWKVVDPGMGMANIDHNGTYWDSENDAVQFALLTWIRGSFMGKPLILDMKSNTRVYPPYDHVYEYHKGDFKSDAQLRSRISYYEYEMIERERERGSFRSKQPGVLQQSLIDPREVNTIISTFYFLDTAGLHVALPRSPGGCGWHLRLGSVYPMINKMTISFIAYT